MSDEQIPEGAVIITPTQVYEEMRSIRDEVKHLSAIIDPALAEIRSDVSENKSRIDIITAERKSADEALEIRVRSIETAGYVTSARMWTAVGILAGVVAALTAVLIAITR